MRDKNQAAENASTGIAASDVVGGVEGGGEVVVFLIGMRVSRWWKIHKWLPVAMAMPRMIRELEQQPELGYLGSESWFGRTTLMLQYWRSRDALMSYARNRSAEHLPAWRHFNQRIGKSGDVGVWHETYVVPNAAIDTVYVNMPAFGLGKVRGALGKAEVGKDLCQLGA